MEALRDVVLICRSTPLQKVLKSPRSRKVDLLLSNVVPPVQNRKTVYRSGQWTPLHRCARKGHTDACRYLLLHGADANLKTMELWSPLHCACVGGHSSVSREEFHSLEGQEGAGARGVVCARVCVLL